MRWLLLPLICMTSCATLQVTGGDVALVNEELARVALEQRGYRVNKVDRRTETGEQARERLRSLGVKVDDRSQHTLQIVELLGDSDGGQARVTLVEATIDAWPKTGVAKVDSIAGTAHWGAGRLDVATWCFNYNRDGVDPSCARDLLQELASRTGASPPS